MNSEMKSAKPVNSVRVGEIVMAVTQVYTMRVRVSASLQST